MKFYAHSKNNVNKKEWHLLKDHLEDTAALASHMATSFSTFAEKLAYITGLLHDAGKYSPRFQARLEGKKIRVEHSSTGAFIAHEKYPLHLARIMSYIIAGHHSGLPDWGSEEREGSLAFRLRDNSNNNSINNQKLKECSNFFEEIKLPAPGEINSPNVNPVNGKGYSLHFLIRFLYSCLVDADYLDTERSLDEQRATHRTTSYSLASFLSDLENLLDRMCENAHDTLVNRKRAEVLANCREKASHPPGLFSLSVPTGGGKTLSSLNFALKHAQIYGKERVIYVIPYTSIIEQNAAVFKDVLGAEQVLEHHSNFDFPEEHQEEQGKMQGVVQCEEKSSPGRAQTVAPHARAWIETKTPHTRHSLSVLI